MKRTVVTAIILVAIGGISGRAQVVIDDPLHGCIIGTDCTDNGIVTPTTVSPLPDFTFTVSPVTSANNPGDLTIYILVPDNEDLTPTTLSYTIKGTSAGNDETKTVSGSSSFIGDWTTDDLYVFLGLTLASGSPKNPLSNWLDYTQGNNCGATQDQTCDPGANGYDVYKVDLGDNLLQGPGTPTAPVLTLSGDKLPLASVLTGFLGSGTTFDTSSDWVSTANSGGIFDAGGPPTTRHDNPPVPEPSSVILLGTVTLGLATLAKRKIKART